MSNERNSIEILFVQVFLPSHLFIQLAKVVEDGENVANFDSVVVVVPAGAAVPTESMSQVRSAMKNVKVVSNKTSKSYFGISLCFHLRKSPESTVRRRWVWWRQTSSTAAEEKMTWARCCLVVP